MENGIYAKPRQGSPFNIVVAAGILKKIKEGRGYWTAATDVGISGHTAAKWRTWGINGEEPYASFWQLVQNIKRAKCEHRAGLSLTEARKLIEDLQPATDFTK